MSKIGILVSISKNSNGWSGEPSKDDLNFSKFRYVKKNALAHESLNFGYPKFPAEPDGTYIGYAPSFNKNLREKGIKIIFFSSLVAPNETKIVGLYVFPEIIKGNGFKRTQSLNPLYEIYQNGNIRVKAKNIVYLKNYVPINDDVAHKLKLFGDKKKSKQGFNYLEEDAVKRLLLNILKSNNDKRIAYWMDLFSGKFSCFDVVELYDSDISMSDKKLKKMEKQYLNAKPKEKLRISKIIERGSIATTVKRLAGYKCLICEKLGMNPLGFAKRNGTYYVETHHVCPVSERQVGSLGFPNLMTVCANHHRQMHYGDVDVLIKKDKFIIKIDNREIEIPKIRVPM